MWCGLRWFVVVGMFAGWGVVLAGAAAGGLVAGWSGPGPVSPVAVVLAGATLGAR